MVKRVFFVHGWGGKPEKDWLPWLEEELEKRGFAVFNLAMPDTDNPKQAAWVEHLKHTVATSDGQCYFVGHSLGVIAILRYLEGLPEGAKVGGVVLVAGFDNDLGIEELRDFFKTPIDWEGIKTHCKRFVSIQSDNDPYDLAKYNDVFNEKLGAEIILEHNMRHFTDTDGITELPIVLQKLLEISDTE